MNEKMSFYLQQNNKLFNGNVLTVCYKADEDENFTDYNLRFADLEVAIQEELAIYELMLNKGDK